MASEAASPFSASDPAPASISNRPPSGIRVWSSRVSCSVGDENEQAVQIIATETALDSFINEVSTRIQALLVDGYSVAAMLCGEGHGAKIESFDALHSIGCAQRHHASVYRPEFTFAQVLSPHLVNGALAGTGIDDFNLYDSVGFLVAHP